jgi:beta-N-acetylhexosaminidase
MHARGRRSPVLVVALVCALVLTAAPGARAAAPDVATTAAPTIAQLIGAKLVIRMNSIAPTPSLIGRVRRGEIGGIVLFGSINITTKAALVSATATLQAAAAAGGWPPLLIMADQEGGNVRTIPWAPTSYSARAMGQDGRSAFVRGRGLASGAELLASGVNVDLAPVADVGFARTGFMYLAGRTFSSSSTTVARLAPAFAAGLAEAAVVATMKHFPGIGRVRLNTDRYVQTVTATRTQLASDLAPFKAAIARGVPMIMLSNVRYTAWDSVNPAGWSRAIGTDLLRGTLGFTGVTITDSLNGTAAARDVSPTTLAFKAARAGTDMIMLTGRETDTKAQFDYLVAKAAARLIPLDRLQASYDRIMALRAGLGD